MSTNLDLWNGVEFAPSASLSELADSLAPVVQGALSDMRAGAESVLSLAGKVPKISRTRRNSRAWRTACGISSRA